MILINKNTNKNTKNEEKIKNIIKLYKLKKILKIPYPLKYYYNSIIPLNIFQTWHTKKLPYLMKKTTDYIIESNPKFNYYLYDDNDCYEFIKNNFDTNVFNAYNSLIPGAYKADLWRYCILYIKGGIYLDIKYKPLCNFKFINLTEKEHFVLDADNIGIYNALIVCLPNNNFLLKAINKIVENVQNKYYGLSPLEPTGPLMLSSLIKNSNEINIDMKHDYYDNFNNRFIYFNNYVIFKSYNGYLKEYNKYKNKIHYGVLWNRHQIYN
jgi:mannosyltransferase OCH1-like enzyme